MDQKSEESPLTSSIMPMFPDNSINNSINNYIDNYSDNYSDNYIDN